MLSTGLNFASESTILSTARISRWNLRIGQVA